MKLERIDRTKRVYKVTMELEESYARKLKQLAMDAGTTQALYVQRLMDKAEDSDVKTDV